MLKINSFMRKINILTNHFIPKLKKINIVVIVVSGAENTAVFMVL